MTSPDATTPTALDDHAELDRFLHAYRPKEVSAAVWLPIAPAATALVRRSGALTRLRVEKDVQVLGAVVAHLVERGRPVTLAEVLSDATLLSYDGHLQASGAKTRTRENKRGILRRLQAVDRGLPWREQRRADGERVSGLVNKTALSQLQRLLRTGRCRHLRRRGPGPRGRGVHQRGCRRPCGTGRRDCPRSGRGRQLGVGEAVRAPPRCEPHQWTLRAIVTHELLDQAVPVAVLAARFRLTRRDLDLALTRVPELPAMPATTHHALLRGSTTRPEL